MQAIAPSLARHGFAVDRQSCSTIHPPSRATTLGKKDRVISDSFPANALHLALTAFAKKVEANTILFWLDQLIQPIPQFRILCRRQTAFKHTKLHPLPIGLQHLVDLGAALVFRNIVGNHNVHSSL